MKKILMPCLWWSAVAIAASACGAESAAPPLQDTMLADSDETVGPADTNADTDHDVSLPPPDAVVVVEPPAPVLVRLTQRQLRNAMTDLLGDDITLPAALEPDVAADGILTAGGSVTSVSARGVELYEDAAMSLATQAMATPERRARVLDCAPPATPVAECRDRFIDTFGRRAWRRPLTAPERTLLAEIHTRAMTALDSFDAGIAWTIAATLQSPYFLYRFESGENDADGKRRYTSFEMASRLAFFLWASPPDDVLLDAAAAGGLVTDEALAIQIDRMLADPKSRRSVAAFFAEWLQLHHLDHFNKDPNIFKHFSPDLGAMAREETLRVVDHLVSDEDADIRELLLTRTTFVNRRLAAIYNVPAPSLDDFGRIDLPADGERRGLLGHVSFLGLHSHPTSSSATLRGMFLRQTLLCDPVPPPPSDLNTAIPEPTPDAPTLRDRLAAHREDPSCAGCHMLTDVPGLGLELFDGIGRFRLTENNARIDASGRLGSADFGGPSELAEVLANQPKFADCAVRKLYTYAVARPPAAGEDMQLQALTSAFIANGRRVKGLMKAIATSQGFRYVGDITP